MIQEVLDAMKKELEDMEKEMQELIQKKQELQGRITASRNAIYQYSGQMLETKKRGIAKRRKNIENKKQQQPQQ